MEEEESKLKNELSLCMVRGEGLRKALDEVYGYASKRVEERIRELDSKEVELKDKSFALEERAKKVEEAEARIVDLEMEVEAKRKELNFIKNQVEVSRGESDAEEARLSQLRVSLEECEAEKTLKESELSEVVETWRQTQFEIGIKDEELGDMKTELERYHALVSAEMESLKKLDEEAERKLKDLTVVQDKIGECEKMFETLSSELVSKEEELEVISQKIELREQAVMSVNIDMKEACQRMETKDKELKDVQKLIKERKAHCKSLKLLIEERSEELAFKEKQRDEITEAIHNSKEELDSVKGKILSMSQREICISEHESARKELYTVKDRYRECLEDLDIKEKELKSVESILTERNKQVEEGEKKMQHLNSSNEELNRQIKLKQKEVCAIRNTIKECSCELEAKRKHCDQVQSSLADLIAEHKSEESQLNSVKQKIQDSLKDFQSKEEEQARFKASLMEREKGLALKEKELSARETRINKKDQQQKSTEKKSARSSKKTQMKAKNLCSICQQQLNSDQHVDLVRDARVFNEKTLELLLRGHLKKRDQLHHDVLSSVKRSSDPAKLVLDTINGLYSAQQRTALRNLDPNSLQRSSIFLLEFLMDMAAKPTTEVQREAIKFATEWKNTTLVNAENPVEVLEFLHFLATFSLAYVFDADNVPTLFDVAFLSKYGPSLCKALGVSALAPINNVLLLNEQQTPEAPVINSCDPCSSEDPGRFVLTSVEDALMNAHQRGGLSLEEPILLMPLVPLLEELGRVGISTDPDLQFEATRVAHQWAGMIGAGVKISQLEVWAFLQFIVGFGLVLKQTQQDETLQLASYVAHFRHAPKLFESLGLTHAIPNFVKVLLKKGLYIPAIRFMFYFNVETNSPLKLLKEHIINLRRSAKENRYESQAEANRDGATLREMMELIEDFKLEIDIPADLILKFMVPASSVPVQSTHMQASDTVIQSSCTATHGSNPSLPTSFGTEPSALLQGQQHSHHAGSKRPRVLDPEGTRPVIRPCFSPPPGSGRF